MPTPRDDQSRVRVNGTVGISLPNDATAPGRARREVRLAFSAWQLPALVDAAVLAVSELVTNALDHGLPPLGLSMRRIRGHVRIDVNDGGHETLTDAVDEGSPDQLAESGRGLDLLRHIADDVGSELVPGDGKNVYASWNVDERPAPR